ncbi:unnamed protein product [Amoebophrya sp. A120]|nr:unnamed protein product [Amoebophrya sp. A120]|eukprot:GSA120T00013613001.1
MSARQAKKLQALQEQQRKEEEAKLKKEQQAKNGKNKLDAVDETEEKTSEEEEEDEEDELAGPVIQQQPRKNLFAAMVSSSDEDEEDSSEDEESDNGSGEVEENYNPSSTSPAPKKSTSKNSPPGRGGGAAGGNGNNKGANSKKATSSSPDGKKNPDKREDHDTDEDNESDDDDLKALEEEEKRLLENNLHLDGVSNIHGSSSSSRCGNAIRKHCTGLEQILKLNKTNFSPDAEHRRIFGTAAPVNERNNMQAQLERNGGIRLPPHIPREAATRMRQMIKSNQYPPHFKKLWLSNIDFLEVGPTKPDPSMSGSCVFFQTTTSSRADESAEQIGTLYGLQLDLNSKKTESLALEFQDIVRMFDPHLLQEFLTNAAPFYIEGLVLIAELMRSRQEYEESWLFCKRALYVLELQLPRGLVPDFLAYDNSFSSSGSTSTTTAVLETTIPSLHPTAYPVMARVLYLYMQLLANRGLFVTAAEVCKWLWKLTYFGGEGNSTKVQVVDHASDVETAASIKQSGEQQQEASARSSTRYILDKGSKSQSPWAILPAVMVEKIPEDAEDADKKLEKPSIFEKHYGSVKNPLPNLPNWFYKGFDPLHVLPHYLYYVLRARKYELIDEICGVKIIFDEKKKNYEFVSNLDYFNNLEYFGTTSKFDPEREFSVPHLTNLLPTTCYVHALSFYNRWNASSGGSSVKKLFDFVEKEPFMISEVFDWKHQLVDWEKLKDLNHDYDQKVVEFEEEVEKLRKEEQELQNAQKHNDRNKQVDKDDVLAVDSPSDEDDSVVADSSANEDIGTSGTASAYSKSAAFNQKVKQLEKQYFLPTNMKEHNSLLKLPTENNAKVLLYPIMKALFLYPICFKQMLEKSEAIDNLDTVPKHSMQYYNANVKPGEQKARTWTILFNILYEWNTGSTCSAGDGAAATSTGAAGGQQELHLQEQSGIIWEELKLESGTAEKFFVLFTSEHVVNWIHFVLEKMIRKIESSPLFLKEYKQARKEFVGYMFTNNVDVIAENYYLDKTDPEERKEIDRLKFTYFEDKSLAIKGGWVQSCYNDLSSAEYKENARDAILPALFHHNLATAQSRVGLGGRMRRGGGGLFPGGLRGNNNGPAGAQFFVDVMRQLAGAADEGNGVPAEAVLARLADIENFLGDDVGRVQALREQLFAMMRQGGPPPPGAASTTPPAAGGEEPPPPGQEDPGRLLAGFRAGEFHLGRSFSDVGSSDEDGSPRLPGPGRWTSEAGQFRRVAQGAGADEAADGLQREVDDVARGESAEGASPEEQGAEGPGGEYAENNYSSDEDEELAEVIQRSLREQ